MNKIVENLIARYPALSCCAEAVDRLAAAAIDTYRNGNKLFTAGNGGSASDADHIAGELLKSFRLRRHLPENEVAELERQFGAEGRELGLHLEPALPCIALHSQAAFVTAFWNDVGADYVYAQQLQAQSRPGDLLIAISTSGNARNVYYAMMAARLRGVRTALLTGDGHGRCESVADLTVAVPASEPYLVQEYHLPIYHAVCLAVEEAFHGGK